MFFKLIKNYIRKKQKLKKYLKEHPCETCVHSKTVGRFPRCFGCYNNDCYEADTGDELNNDYNA